MSAANGYCVYNILYQVLSVEKKGPHFGPIHSTPFTSTAHLPLP